MRNELRSSRGLLYPVLLLLPWMVLAASAVPFDAAKRAEVLAATPSEDAPYLIHLDSRIFLPRARASVAASGDEKAYVQFKRTLTIDEQSALEAAGIVFHDSLGPFTYLARVPRTAVEALERHPLFLGAEPVEPTDKVTATIFRGAFPAHARRPGDEADLFFRFYDNVRLSEALAVLDRAGVLVLDPSAFLFGNRIEALASRDQILEACASPLVRAAYEVPPPISADNQQAAGISNVPPVNVAPYSLNGSGVAVGIWDEGQVRSTHGDLSPRIVIREAAQPIANHSTHVAGTILGTGAGNPAAKGMASQVVGYSYDYQGDVPTEQANSSRLPTVGGDWIVLSNNSWEYNYGWRPVCPTLVCTMHNDPNCYYEHNPEDWFGAYDAYSVSYDDLVRKMALTVVKSAGNDGTDCGPADCAAARNTDCDGVLEPDGFRYDIIDEVGSAKNVIAVGALEDDGVTKTDFSSAGPANDGRVKPDLVANGRDLTSTWGTSDTAYSTLSGTSQSAPVVSGIIALVDNAWKDLHGMRSPVLNKPTPELVKALLVNTAIDLGRPGPDYAYGFGLARGKEAVDQLQAPNPAGGSLIAPDHVRTAFISEGETLNFKISTPAGAPTGTMKTTAAWSDLSGSSASVVRYCNFINGKVPCTSNADCTIFTPSGVCDPAPCGAVPCDLKNDLNTFQWNTAATAVIGLPWVPPGAGAITGNAYQYFNHIDPVETIQTSDSNGGDFPYTVFGFTVNGGQQRFTVSSNRKLIYFPPNDNFASAWALPALVPADPTATDCASGQVPCPATLYPHNTWDSVNFDATAEAGEPASNPSVPQAHSVWFTWVAPSNGQATFDTAGADFDTTLEVWTGSSIGSLTNVGFNDDFYARQSKVTFNAVAGTTYRIQVRGHQYPAGTQDTSMGVFPLNYYLIVCGNGVVEAGEQCDDGNSTNGDCCSSTCVLAAGGSACTVGGNACVPGTCSGQTCVLGSPLNCDDANVCTDDSCNPASGCVHANNNASCDDGNACTTNDVCSFGTCAGSPSPVPVSTPTLTMTSAIHLTWTALPGATSYDIVRGNLLTLRSSGGDFTAATDVCLGDNVPSTSFDDAGTPAPGGGWFYLTRGTNCSGSGTYDTSSPKQVASRDAEIDAAAAHCATTCDRGRCMAGPPLDARCDSCVNSICAEDPVCCTSIWDSICVSEVRTICGSLTCPESGGVCAHTVCSAGGALTAGCDDPPVTPSCAANVCADDPFCCNNSWDALCVSEVPTHCAYNCN